MGNRGPPLGVTALLLRALEAFGYYVSLLSARSVHILEWPRPPDVAAIHVNMSNVLKSMGKYEEALVELKKGLDVLVTVYGHEHPDVASCYQSVRKC